jgi:phosphoglycolate phosphatase
MPIPNMSQEFDAVIWDFNGTLIDDVDLTVRSVNVQLERRSLPQITVDRFRQVFRFPVEDYYRRIGLDPTAESMSELSAEFHEEYMRGLLGCSLHVGVGDALERFKTQGVRQFVLSAMGEEMLHSAIEHLGVGGYFAAIYGLAHLEGDSKISRGRDLMNDYGIVSETALLIGDTDHDAEVAEVLGISVILIAQGYQSEARCRATGRPVYRSVRILSEAHGIGDAASPTW